MVGTPDRKWVLKLSISLCAAAIAVLALTPAMEHLLERLPFGRLDRAGHAYYNETLTRAAATYAVVRGINGIISAIQGTEVAASPAGIGLTVAAGELLDPVNDLVERFSWVLLLATASLGVQKLLLGVGAWFGFSILLPIALACGVIGIWLPADRGGRLRTVARHLLVFALVVRFGIPLVAMASERIYVLFLETPYTEATQSLESLHTEVRDGAMELARERGSSAWGRLESMLDPSEAVAALKERLFRFQDRIARYADHTLDLVAIFVLQTVVIPLAVLWGLFRLAGYRPPALS